jgi:hypothetical protein
MTEDQVVRAVEAKPSFVSSTWTLAFAQQAQHGVFLALEGRSTLLILFITHSLLV